MYEEEDLDGKYPGRRYGRRRISFYPRRGGGNRRGSGKMLPYSSGERGGVGRIVAAGPVRTICLGGVKEETAFLKMQICWTQLSRK